MDTASWPEGSCKTEADERKSPLTSHPVRRALSCQGDAATLREIRAQEQLALPVRFESAPPIDLVLTNHCGQTRELTVTIPSSSHRETCSARRAPSPVTTRSPPLLYSFSLPPVLPLVSTHQHTAPREETPLTHFLRLATLPHLDGPPRPVFRPPSLPPSTLTRRTPPSVTWHRLRRRPLSRRGGSCSCYRVFIPKGKGARSWPFREATRGGAPR
jgi:hypothetical protein